MKRRLKDVKLPKDAKALFRAIILAHPGSQAALRAGMSEDRVVDGALELIDAGLIRIQTDGERYRIVFPTS